MNWETSQFHKFERSIE